MYRILIIDDEAIIRQGLIGYIDWNSLNCVVVNDFENGLHAIDFLKNHNVDIVISDIKMPGADGIEVAKFVYENCPLTKTILYTGYSDFEYAKSAIKYNVADFIVKPSTIENIVKVLKETITKIENLRHKDKHMINLESQLNSIYQKEKINIIRNFVQGIKMNKSFIEKTLKSYNLNIKNFCLLLYRMSRAKPISDTQTIQFINLSLSDLEQYTFILNKTTYATLVSLGENPQVIYKSKLIEKCEEINNFVTEYIKGTIYVGISDIHNTLLDAPIALAEAQKCLDNSFYVRSPITIFSNYNGPRDNPTFAEINLEKITEYLNKNHEEQSIKTIKDMFKTMSNNKEPVEYTKSMGVAIYTVLMNIIHRHNLKSSDIFDSEDPYQEILNSENLDDLIEILISMVHKIVSYLSESNNNYIVKKVNEYIKNNYHKPIKLADIANHIHINSSYLSRLYKDKTSQTITETLRNIRIEEAKSLLINSDIKAYEIASLVGFDDPAYFSYVFKQETGYSPSQFRNHYT